MQKGKIVRLNNGFGFIEQEGEDKDLFFHANELEGVEFNELKEGDELNFEIAESPKGFNAVQVKRA